MKMNKILTAVCVLAAASAVAAGISGEKLALADGSSCIMDSKEQRKSVFAEESESDFCFAKDLSDEEQKQLLEEYEKNGILNKDGVLYYQNKPIRCFVDTCKVVERVNKAGGKTMTFSNICTYVNWNGKIDLYTVRKEIKSKGKSSKTSGKIKSIKQASSLRDMFFAASAKSLEKIAETGYEKEGVTAISELLPFLPQESIYAYAKEAATDGRYGELTGMVQFLSEEKVSAIVNEEYERTGIAGVKNLLPLMSQESIDKLANKVVAKKDYDSLEKMAFRINSALLDDIAKE